MWWPACSAVRRTALKCWHKMSSATAPTAPQNTSMQVCKAQCSTIRKHFGGFERYLDGTLINMMHFKVYLVQSK